MKANKRRVVIWKRRETLVMAMKSREKRRAVVVVVVGFKVKKKKKKKKSSMTRWPDAACGDRPLIGGWLLAGGLRFGPIRGLRWTVYNTCIRYNLLCYGR